MNIQCPGCKSSNTFNPDEITKSGKRAVCVNCKLPFLIEQKQAEAQSGGTRDKVMVANANPQFRSAIKDFLASRGFEIVLAKDGIEALQSLEITMPNIALVDVALPGMYGFEICDFIKSSERLKNIKIILLASIYDTTRYKRAPTSIYGADDYIEMHHIHDQLVPKINRLFGKDEGFARPPLKMLAKEFLAVAIGDEVSSQKIKIPLPQEEDFLIGDEAFSQKIKEIAAKDIKIEPPADSGLGKAHEQAKRLARIIISDIILYNQEAVQQGLRRGNLLELLKDDIKEAQAYYAKRVPPGVREKTFYLKDAFEELIAKMRKEMGV